MHRLVVISLGLLLVGCSRTPEENAARYLREGKDLFAKKDYPRAILQFKNASKYMPNNAEPYYQLGVVAAAMGDNAAAAEYMHRAVALDPKDLNAILALADLFTRGALPSAIEEGRRLAHQALSIAPANVKALNLAALADLRTGKAKAAASQLEDILRQHPNDAETSINLARVRLALRDHLGAEELLLNTAKSTHAAQVFFALADFYNITGHPSEAAEWYARGLEIEPGNAQAVAALGRLQASAGHQQEADATFARLAQNPDQRFRYAYAVRLLASGRKDAAAAEFARIFKQNPEDREARTNLINIYLESGRIAEAEELMAKALDADSKDVDALAQRARAHLLRGRVEMAEKDLNIVRRYRPESAEVHYLTALVYRHRQNIQLQQLELSEALRLDPHYLPARIELSRSWMGQEPERALTLLDATPEEQQQNPDLQVQRIWPLIELKRFSEARSAVDALIGGGNPEVLLQDAVLRMMQLDFSGAQNSARKAAQSNPADVRALEIVMRSAVGLKQPAEGLEWIRRYAAQNRNLAVVQIFLGHIELQAGHAGPARAAFEAAKAADPAALDADWNLIDLDTVERKLDSARNRLSPLVQGSTEAMARAKLALVEEIAGRYEAASQQYKRVLMLRPSDAGVLNNLAYMLAESMGNPTEALQYATTAKELEPANAAVDDTLGWTYYHLGRYAEAIRHLELAVKRTPNARRQAHLAMAYARYGDGVRARQTLRSALKMDPALPEAFLAQKVVSGVTP